MNNNAFNPANQFGGNTINNNVDNNFNNNPGVGNFTPVEPNNQGIQPAFAPVEPNNQGIQPAFAPVEPNNQGIQPAFAPVESNNQGGSYAPFSAAEFNQENAQIPFGFDTPTTVTTPGMQVIEEQNPVVEETQEATSTKKTSTSSKKTTAASKKTAQCKKSPYADGYKYSRNVEIPVKWGTEIKFYMPLEIQFEPGENEYSYIKKILATEHNIAEANYDEYMPEYMGGFYELVRVMKSQAPKFLG